jgi:hypothetical protein
MLSLYTGNGKKLKIIVRHNGTEETCLAIDEIPETVKYGAGQYRLWKNSTDYCYELFIVGGSGSAVAGIIDFTKYNYVDVVLGAGGNGALKIFY